MRADIPIHEARPESANGAPRAPRKRHVSSETTGKSNRQPDQQEAKPPKSGNFFHMWLN
jgi:hypothetical protein